MVRPPAPRWGAGGDLSPEVGANGARPDRVPNDPVLRDGILHLRSPAGKPEELENRPTTSRQSEIPTLRRHDAGGLPSADGQEAAGVAGHGGQVLFRRTASDQRRG